MNKSKLTERRREAFPLVLFAVLTAGYWAGAPLIYVNTNHEGVELGLFLLFATSLTLMGLGSALRFAEIWVTEADRRYSHLHRWANRSTVAGCVICVLGVVAAIGGNFIGGEPF